MRQIPKPALASLACLCCLCVLVVGKAGAFPRDMGRYDEDKLGKQKEAQQMLEDLNFKLSLESDDVVRIGSGFTVGEDDVIEGDIVIIGGGLTIKGVVEGDAVVIGGSMYLESTAMVEGDAAVIGGLLEMEEGATVKGEVVENPETTHSPWMSDIHEKGEEERMKGEPVDEVVKFGQDIHIERDEIVDGDVVAIGGDIRIDGHVTGDVVTTAGDITVGSSGHVEGDVVATFGRITMEAGAVIEGEVTEVSMGGVKTKAAYEACEAAPGEKSIILVSLHRPDADEVRLTGTFIDWDEDGIEMKRDDEGTWKTTISLGPGSYQYKFIVDGEWIHDPDMEERVPDGRGGYATPFVIKSKGMPKTKDKVSIIFSLDRPGINEVKVIGSWDDWNPMGTMMERDEDGVFKTMIALEPGLHGYMFCIDGDCVPDPDEPDKIIRDRDGDKMTSVVVKPKSWDTVLIKFWHERPDVRDMRLTGGFNNWDPEGIPMYKDQDGNWFTYVALPPGDHLYKFYIDGVWGPDPDVEESVPDGRGGYATRFTVKSPRKKQGVTVAMSHEDWMKRKGFHVAPALDYNRVDGVYLAGIIRYGSTNFPEPNIYIEGGYSKKRDRGLYKFELEQPLFEPLGLSVGGSLYDLTDNYDREIVSDWENILAALFFKFDYRDYFDRRGVSGFATLKPMKGHTLKATYMGDEYRPLEKKADAALFRRSKHFRPNPRSSYQICYDPEAEDKTCDVIKVRAWEIAYEMDTRDCSEAPTSGFLVRLSGEWARQDWGGDLDYSRYVGDIRRYHRISRNQHLGLRLKAGFMDIPDDLPCGCAPRAHFFFPKEFYVGGIGTLPGYGYKAYRGTHMLLANFEYNYMLRDEIGIQFFSNAGDARGQEAALAGKWDVDEVWEDLKIKFDAGVALRIESSCDHNITLGIAQRLDDLDKGAVVTIRASRMF